MPKSDFHVNTLKAVAACILAAFLPAAALANTLVLDESQDKPEPSIILIPYLFYTPVMGLGAGVAGGVTCAPQPQMSLGGTYLESDNGATIWFLMANKVQFRPFRRMFFDFQGSVGNYPELTAYTGMNPDFPGERAGSNESSEDNYTVGPGRDDWMDIKFEYVVPIGYGKDHPLATYVLRRGQLLEGASGGEVWNPLKSGRTFARLKPFYRSARFDDRQNIGEFETNGLALQFEYDNRDFPANPERGSIQSLSLDRDFGWFKSRNTWTTLKFDASKYLAFKGPRIFRQNVLALNFWTADTPTWDVRDGVIENRPPYYLGASLGGMYRMRAYPFYRYNDKSAIYYGAEYRAMLRGLTVKTRYLDVDWWQVVGFGEVGRVAPTWNLQTLHQDMKWDLGLGLRAMVSRVVVRADAAANNDSWGLWFMADHPF